jgi:hypothetical protein
VLRAPREATVPASTLCCRVVLGIEIVAAAGLAGVALVESPVVLLLAVSLGLLTGLGAHVIDADLVAPTRRRP